MTEHEIEKLQIELDEANAMIEELKGKLDDALSALDEIKDIAYKAL